MAVAPHVVRADLADDGIAPVPALARSARVINPPVLFLLPQRALPFLKAREELMARVLDTEGAGPAHARALTDLAELHLSHGMTSEALSILGNVTGTELPLAHRLRAAALELVVGLTDPLDRPLTDRAEQLLDPKHADWADQPMLRVMSELKARDCAAAAPELPEAFLRSDRFPAPLRARVLPPLLDCAIESRRWGLARDIAARFADHPELRDGTALHYLLGRVAEAGNDPLAAFDSYVRAQGGDDLWAHRARRAIVDLGLREEVLEPAEAVKLLSIETELWRGDDHAARTLDDLASLQAITEDRLGALETYGRLLQRHPGTPQASAARQKARSLVEALYADGENGTLSLSRFMEVHARLTPWFRFEPSFALVSEGFADHFRDLGATTVAATEYGAIRDYLTAGADLGLFETSSAQLERLAVKEAEAMLEGAQFDALGALLADPPEPQDAELARRLELVKARYFDETGQAAELVAGASADAPEQVLRLRAQAQFGREDWLQAQAAYALLAERTGDDLPLPDAIRYMLAAHRSGDAATAAALAARFEGLTDLPQWAEIAATLTSVAPQLLPLRQGTARERLDSAGEMLDRLSEVQVPPDVN